MTDVADVSSVAKLLGSKRLTGILSDIAKYTAKPSDMSSTGGPIEENPEYSLVVTANNTSVEVDNEILLVHKFIRDHYAPRFPELEQLILDPWVYCTAVKAIGNTDDLTRANFPPASFTRHCSFHHPHSYRIARQTPECRSVPGPSSVPWTSRWIFVPHENRSLPTSNRGWLPSHRISRPLSALGSLRSSSV